MLAKLFWVAVPIEPLNNLFCIVQDLEFYIERLIIKIDKRKREAIDSIYNGSRGE